MLQRGDGLLDASASPGRDMAQERYGRHSHPEGNDRIILASKSQFSHELTI